MEHSDQNQFDKECACPKPRHVVIVAGDLYKVNSWSGDLLQGCHNLAKLLQATGCGVMY